MYEFKMQPSEMWGLPFWKTMSLIDMITEMDKERKKDEDDKKGGDDYKKMYRDIKKQISNQKLPKTPRL